MPHSYSLRPHLLLLPSPHLHKFFITLAFTEDLGWCFRNLVLLAIPSAGFQPLFPIPSPLLSYICVDLLPPFLICCEERRGRENLPTHRLSPALFSSFPPNGHRKELTFKGEGGEGEVPITGGGGTELSRRGFFFWRAVRRGGGIFFCCFLLSLLLALVQRGGELLWREKRLFYPRAPLGFFR